MLRAFLTPLVAIGLLAAAPLFAADETYTLKLHTSKKGDKTEHEKNETTKTTVLINVAGTNKKEEKTEIKKDVYTEEILEKKVGDRRATKLTRTYSVAEKTVDGETTKASYTGQTVLIEKKGDKYEFSIKGKVIKENEALDLDKEFSEKKDNDPKTEDFLPDTPIKVGGNWKIPAEKSEKMFKTLSGEKMKVDAKKSTIEGKLLKAYKKDGAQFAVLELTITAFVTDLDIGGQLAKTTAGSKMVLTATVDTCIDGTIVSEDVKLTGIVDFAAEIPDVGSISIKSTTTGIEKVSASKR